MNYLGINHLLAKSFANTFSHSAGCLFILLIVAFAVEKRVSFNRSHVGVFLFLVLLLYLLPWVHQCTLRLHPCMLSCPTLCDHMDCSPPCSTVHEIFQAKILKWIVISSSTGSS